MDGAPRPDEEAVKEAEVPVLPGMQLFSPLLYLFSHFSPLNQILFFFLFNKINIYLQSWLRRRKQKFWNLQTSKSSWSGLRVWLIVRFT